MPAQCGVRGDGREGLDKAPIRDDVDTFTGDDVTPAEGRHVPLGNAPRSRAVCLRSRPDWHQARAHELVSIDPSNLGSRGLQTESFSTPTLVSIAESVVT